MYLVKLSNEWVNLDHLVTAAIQEHDAPRTPSLYVTFAVTTSAEGGDPEPNVRIYRGKDADTLINRLTLIADNAPFDPNG